MKPGSFVRKNDHQRKPLGGSAVLVSCASVALIALALWVGCSKSDTSNEILIGEYSSLTGTTATFGQSTHQGLELAIEEVNAAGGVLGKKVRLITEDTQSKPEEAALVVTKLITREKVSAIVGEVASSRSLAAAPICQANKIPMVTPSSTNPEVTRKGDYIFRVCYIDPFQGSVLARFAFNSLGVRNVAILKDVKNDYSIGLAEFFEKDFTALGGTVVTTQAYSEGDTDFKAQLTALKSTNPEAIFIPGYYTEAALIAKQARELNLMMPLLGGDGWVSEKLIEIGGEAMNNTYYSDHYSSEDTSAIVRNFVAAFKVRFGTTPDAIAALAYDAGKLVVDAMSRAGSVEGPKVRDALAATKDFQGVAGKITIDAERNAQKPVVIIAVENGLLKYRETINP